MSAQDDDAIYTDDGEYAGHMIPIENGGGFALVNDAGEIVAAIDENQNEIDPSDFVFQADDATEYGDERLAALQQQVAALEERVEQPLPVYDAGPSGPSDEEIQDRLQVTLGRLENYLGRTTTDRERNELAERAIEDGSYDLVVAAGALRAEGRLRDYRTGSDVHNHTERVAHATELLAEQDGSAPDPLTGQPQREAEDYDMSTHEGRTARALDVMAGYDDTADTSYDSRTFEAE